MSFNRYCAFSPLRLVKFSRSCPFYYKFTMSDADVAAPVAAAPAKVKLQKAPKKKAAGGSTKSKTAASHPQYKVMIAAAISALKERGGSSRQAILKYITANYKVGDNPTAINARLKAALKAGVKAEALKQSKGTGAAGSFRLGEKAEKKPKVKKVAEKKPKSPKKAVAAKPKKAAAKKVAKSPKKAKKPAAPKKAKSPKKPAAAKPKKPKSPKKPAAAKPKVAKKPAAAKKPKAAKKAAAEKKE